MYVCRTCHRQVRPRSEPGIVFAVERQWIKKTESTEYVETVGGFFHEDCLPSGSSQWRRRPMPPDIDDGEGEH
jgi:hypothetical protein